MNVEQSPVLRASDLDRDALLVRLHHAYAEGRLDEAELDERIEATLAARTHADLDRIAADLPVHRTSPWTAAPEPSRFHLAYKSEIRRTGRWRCPDTATVAVYKGGYLLDLRDADLPPHSTLRVLAYKSTVRIIVPPGTRVESGGPSLSTNLRTTPTGPTIRIKAYAYRGTIEATEH